ncbi:Mitochondrial inner membrane i-AAA protease supercomplex subunit MGR1 [Nakaseomyces bracarensis]|uniref:Mitochondrial inner membrane i-AAA protease supercomplex subunit MGR1 n=1 Tax=Nakaseomyces bracarensis TaxID=273131 RepID=A0ABR4NYK2_9SACH
MGIFTPPGQSDNNKKDSLVKKETPEEDVEKFWVRPSLGLRLWGPLVPASDNKTGLWTLVAIQSSIGLLCFYKYKSLRLVNGTIRSAASKTTKSAMETPLTNRAPSGNQVKAMNEADFVKKDIADFPTLNRFSTTHGDMFVNTQNVQVGANAPSSTIVPDVSKTVLEGQTDSAGITGLLKYFRRKDNKQSFFKSDNWLIFKKVFYLLAGTVILSQSMLEACRLTILKYDPWCEEAKTVREKKFFNNIVKFYHEGIDPTKVKVKDAVSGNIMPTNVPEVKQSVALVRAQSEAENPVIAWFGPIEYKPMSFSEFLDRLEFHLDMFEYFQSKRTANETALGFLTTIRNETERLKEDNVKNRRTVLEKLQKDVEAGEDASQPGLKLDKRKPFMSPNSRSIILEEDVKHPEDIDLNDMWSLYDPWLNLALETSLSIKFIPTVFVNNNANEEQQNDKTTISKESTVEPTDSEDKI